MLQLIFSSCFHLLFMGRQNHKTFFYVAEYFAKITNFSLVSKPFHEFFTRSKWKGKSSRTKIKRIFARAKKMRHKKFISVKIIFMIRAFLLVFETHTKREQNGAKKSISFFFFATSHCTQQKAHKNDLKWTKKQKPGKQDKIITLNNAAMFNFCYRSLERFNDEVWNDESLR